MSMNEAINWEGNAIQNTSLHCVFFNLYPCTKDTSPKSLPQCVRKTLRILIAKPHDQFGYMTI